MNCIEEYSNWCHIDRLEGVDLVDGETLRLTWPDDTQTTQQIVVKRTSYTISDMGSPYQVPVKRAYVIEVVRGLKVEVPIKGLKAERVS